MCNLFKKKINQFFCLFLVVFLFGCSDQKTNINQNQNQSDQNLPTTISTEPPNISPTFENTSPVTSPAHDYEVTILMYHYIRDYNYADDPIGSNLSVSPANFEKQMQWLKEHDYQTFALSDFDKISRLDPKTKAVILTFDDGYKDAYEQAYPILKKYGFIGVFYIIAGSVGDGAYMSWDQIKELHQNGMIIGSHTISHPDLRNISDTELVSQLAGSRSLIKDNTGIVTTDFCYPAGKYNETVIQKLQELGYQTATTVASGLATQDSSLYELPRYRITNDVNFDNFFTE
mgnify:CR=1 FL=1